MNPLDLLTGYKTYVTGVGLIGYAMYLFSQEKFTEGITALTSGIGLITGRRAADRPLSLVKNLYSNSRGLTNKLPMALVSLLLLGSMVATVGSEDPFRNVGSAYGDPFHNAMAALGQERPVRDPFQVPAQPKVIPATSILIEAEEEEPPTPCYEEQLARVRKEKKTLVVFVNTSIVKGNYLYTEAGGFGHLTSGEPLIAIVQYSHLHGKALWTRNLHHKATREQIHQAVSLNADTTGCTCGPNCQCPVGSNCGCGMQHSSASNQPTGSWQCGPNGCQYVPTPTSQLQGYYPQQNYQQFQPMMGGFQFFGGGGCSGGGCGGGGCSGGRCR